MNPAARIAALILGPMLYAAMFAALTVGLHAAWGRRGLATGIAAAGLGSWLLGPGILRSEQPAGTLRTLTPFFIGVAAALAVIAWRRARQAAPAARMSPGAQHPAARRRLDPLTLDAMRRNLVALVVVVVPLIAMLNRGLDYLGRIARGYDTGYLRIANSIQLVDLFADAYRALAIPLLIGGLAYEWLLAGDSPPKRLDAGALWLTPVILMPALIAGSGSGASRGLSVVLGVLIYVALVRRLPPQAGTAHAPTAATPGTPTSARGRRYAVWGATLGFSLGTFVVIGTIPADGATTYDWDRTLALAADELFPWTVPLGVPLHMLVLGYDALWTAPLYRVAAFVLAAPAANGALLGWALGKLIDVATARPHTP